MAKDKEPVEILTASAEQTEITKTNSRLFWLASKDHVSTSLGNTNLKYRKRGMHAYFRFLFFQHCGVSSYDKHSTGGRRFSVRRNHCRAGGSQRRSRVSDSSRDYTRESLQSPRRQRWKLWADADPARHGTSYGLSRLSRGLARSSNEFEVCGNESRAALLYARGYYGEAKRRGFSPYGSSQ
jgi:hypothetical protein